MATRSKVQVCGRSSSEIVGSNPTGARMSVCCECCVLSGRCLCDELITRPEESYRLWCVVGCDLEALWLRRPRPTGGCYTRNKKKTYDLTMGFLFQHLHSRNKWLTKKHGTLFLLRSSDCQECPVLEVRISFRNSRYCTTCISADTFQIHSFTTSFNITFPPTSAFHSDLFHSDFPTELCKHSSSLPLVRHCSTKVNH